MILGGKVEGGFNQKYLPKVKKNVFMHITLKTNVKSKKKTLDFAHYSELKFIFATDP